MSSSSSIAASTVASSSASSTTGTAAATTTDTAGSAQTSEGITLVAFVTALIASLIVFGVQLGLFLLLRNKLARIL
jgi:calcium permeable stress-gated cation channel